MMDLHGIPKDVVDSYLLFPDRDRFIPVAKNIEDLIIWAIDDIGVKQGSFLGWMIGSPVKIKKVNKEEFSTAIEKGISLWDNDAFNNVDEYKDQDINDNDIVGWSYDDAPIVKMVNKLLYQGV